MRVRLNSANGANKIDGFEGAGRFCFLIRGKNGANGDAVQHIIKIHKKHQGFNNLHCNTPLTVGFGMDVSISSNGLHPPK